MPACRVTWFLEATIKHPVSVVSGGLASSAQHHRTDGLASSLGHVSMGKERFVVGGGRGGGGGGGGG